MRISDWSSDVCSSDLPHRVPLGAVVVGGVEEQVLARGDVVCAHSEVVALTGQHVHVEEHLLARHRLALGQVGRGLHRCAAPDRVLLALDRAAVEPPSRSEELTPELQSLKRISYAVFCLKKTKQQTLY